MDNEKASVRPLAAASSSMNARSMARLKSMIGSMIQPRVKNSANSLPEKNSRETVSGKSRNPLGFASKYLRHDYLRGNNDFRKVSPSERTRAMSGPIAPEIPIKADLPVVDRIQVCEGMVRYEKDVLTVYFAAIFEMYHAPAFSRPFFAEYSGEYPRSLLA